MYIYMYMYCLDFNNKKDYDDHNKYLCACRYALINVAMLPMLMEDMRINVLFLRLQDSIEEIS